MGFTPAQIDQMSYWQFAACIDGYVSSNGGGKAAAGNAEIDDSRLSKMGIEGF